jgi:hypothetical protein
MTMYDEVEALVLQGLWPAEVKTRVRAASGRTIDQYCSTVMRRLPPEDRVKVEALRVERGRPKGGAKEFFQRKPMGERHIVLGSKLYYFRKDRNLSHSEFSTDYQFSNRVQLSTMEQGYHDFTLNELLRLSEILSIPFDRLFEPVLEVQ